jgi:CTP synthase (UTP-ammonia lyase)
MKDTTRIAVIGDFKPTHVTHTATNAALADLGLSFEWVPTDEIGHDPASRLANASAVWIAPASPYRSMDGALAAIRYAREADVPLVGT